MARDRDRVTPSTHAGTASGFASRSATETTRVEPMAIATPIPDRVPQAPRAKSPSVKAIERMQAEINGLKSGAPAGEAVYMDVLSSRHEFDVYRVRMVSDEEIAFDGLDARGKPAKIVQHYTQLSYHLRTEAPPAARQPIEFNFRPASDPSI